jgi:hypothetical protein
MLAAQDTFPPRAAGHLFWTKSMKGAVSAFVFTGLIGVAAPATATIPCTATILHSFTTNPNNFPSGSRYFPVGSEFHKRGEKYIYITAFEHKGDISVFCAHGSYCIPAKIKIRRELVPTLKLDNCVVDFRHPNYFYGITSYELKIIRNRFSTRELRRLDLENALQRYGIRSDRIEQYGQAYAKYPNTQCGLLARRVMRGDRRAIIAMKRDVGPEGKILNPCLQVLVDSPDPDVS